MDKTALVGEYVIKYPHGSETLHLGEDEKLSGADQNLKNC